MMTTGVLFSRKEAGKAHCNNEHMPHENNVNFESGIKGRSDGKDRGENACECTKEDNHIRPHD